jgi:hypothetical protein
VIECLNALKPILSIVQLTVRFIDLSHIGATGYTGSITGYSVIMNYRPEVELTEVDH